MKLLPVTSMNQFRLEYVFQLPYRYFAVLISMIAGVLSILISTNFAKFLLEGETTHPYFIHPPMQFLLPIIIMIILIWKSKNIKKVEANLKGKSG